MTIDRSARRRPSLRRALALPMAGGVAIASVLLGTAGPAAAAPITVVVDPADRMQTLEGWGTSFAWWANVLGGWTPSQRAAVADALFAPSGLDLNIVRYNLGAGTNPDPNKNMRVGAEVPTFNPSNGVYDWTADANQRTMLAEAQSRGVDIVEGFVNSPPAWMLANACTAGAPNGGNNLPAGNVTAFARYLGEVTQHFRSSWNTTFRTVSPFNEPNSPWWRCGNNQEGNHVDRGQQETILTAVAGELASRGLPTRVAGGEEYSVSDSLGSWNSYSTAARTAAGQINTHTYGGFEANSPLRVAARTAGKRLWGSEVGVGGSAPHDHADLTSALQLADRITTDLTELRADGWVYWQAVENESGNNNYGFIHADFTGPQNSYVTKQYYAMANFSRHIPPGSIVIQANDDDTLATFDPATGKLTLVSSNDGSAGRELRFDLSRFGSVTGSAARYETSATNSATQLTSVPVSSNAVTVTLPAKSITTLVVPGLSLPSIGTNLIANPGFEAGSTASGWTADGSASQVGVETSFPQSGTRDGYLHPTSTQDAGLSQTFTAASSGSYTFSAYAATNLVDGVLLGIEVGGQRVDSRPVVGGVGYRRYDLTATVQAGQTVRISYAAPKTAGWATLDSTSLAVRPTLLQNAGFETGSLASWTVEWHPNRAIVETNFPYTGRYDGSLQPTATDDVALAQTVTAPTTKTYTLTAKVASSGGAVQLGVDVAGTQAAAATVTGGAGNQTRSLTFTASAGQPIKVWYYSPAMTGWATLDDVTLG